MVVVGFYVLLALGLPRSGLRTVSTRLAKAGSGRIVQPKVATARPDVQRLVADLQEQEPKQVHELQANVRGVRYEMLSGLSQFAYAERDDAGRGVLLSFRGAKTHSSHTFTLGKLRCSRVLAGARTKRWWMGPTFGRNASSVPPETQFLLVELQEGADAYGLVMPLVSGAMRCTLRGTEGGELTAQVQSGDPDVTSTGMDPAVFIASGDDPYELLESSFRTVADTLGTFEVSSRKPPAADLDLFGWCTWDAFYQAVDPAGISSGVESLHAAGTPPRMLIIDDGWQTVAQDGETARHVVAEATAMSSDDAEEAQRLLNKPQENRPDASNPLVDAVVDFYQRKVDGADGHTMPVRVWRALANTVLKNTLRRFFAEKTEFSKRLSAFHANAKFEDAAEGTTLRGHVSELRSRFGDLRIYCWHTLGGYWGGISTESDCMQSLLPFEQYPSPTSSLLEVEPALGWDAAALNGVGTAAVGRELQVFHGIHSYLADAGIDGVKIDAQSGLGPFGKGVGGGPEMVRRQVHAMESSVSKYFDGNRCVNCMCHSTENLFSYKATNIVRAADDFYPSDDPSQPVHLAHIAFNSLFLGEIGTPDWDMFTSTHKDAGMHAAARAVSGGPLYVSDRPGQHNPELLRKLVLPDGTHLRCRAAGRPTRDSLFSDPNVRSAAGARQILPAPHLPTPFATAGTARPQHQSSTPAPVSTPAAVEHARSSQHVLLT